MLNNNSLYPYGSINNINIYVDPLKSLDDNNILVGRKQATNILNAANTISSHSRFGNANFIIVNSKLANILKLQSIRKERFKKLKNILNNE